jgi:hypothetical protein
MIDECIKEVGMKHLIVILFANCAATGVYAMDKTTCTTPAPQDSLHRFVTIQNAAPVPIEVQTRQMFGSGKEDWNGRVQEISPWQQLESHTSAEFKWLLEFTKINAEQRPELCTMVTNRVRIRIAELHQNQNIISQPLPTHADYANDHIITVDMADGSLYFE